jgi:hypothetical protein
MYDFFVEEQSDFVSCLTKSRHSKLFDPRPVGGGYNGTGTGWSRSAAVSFIPAQLHTLSSLNLCNDKISSIGK